jgi:hypothetical protein
MMSAALRVDIIVISADRRKMFFVHYEHRHQDTLAGDSCILRMRRPQLGLHEHPGKTYTYWANLYPPHFAQGLLMIRNGRRCRLFLQILWCVTIYVVYEQLELSEMLVLK